ncbi:hypothetical protein [Embleya sp. NBC_00896]|uniref:hypothetical protein n=1 Tax=Embleya sp. NBC_00896 TaxID=2975961 RepID=UPI00386461FB|nr:hypothetical protein OG928_05150 [Embleya sp. NBC_00896]
MDGLVVLAVSACLLGLTVLLVVRSLARRDLSTAPKDLLREDLLEPAEWPQNLTPQTTPTPKPNPSSTSGT